MTRAFFDDVADALRGFLPRDARAFSSRASARNLKVWFGSDAHEHYEVQIISASVARRRGAVLEVGFHAEHLARDANEAALERVRGARRVLGTRAEAAAFVGRPSPWMRLSELWEGGDLTSPETAIEAAERLAAYIRAIEPLRSR